MKLLTALVLFLIWAGFCWMIFNGFHLPFPRVATGASAVVLTWATHGWVFAKLSDLRRQAGGDVP